MNILLKNILKNLGNLKKGDSDAVDPGSNEAPLKNPMVHHCRWAAKQQFGGKFAGIPCTKKISLYSMLGRREN